MAPLCAVIMVDYFLVRNGNIHVPSCYNGNKNGLYWFWCGVNWIGVAAWLFGTTMGIPGLIGQYQPKLISDAARYMYMMGWLLTFFTSAILYAIGTMIKKPRIFPVGFETSPFKWEWLANEGREGFFDGERDGGDQFYPSASPTIEGEEVEIGEKREKDEKIKN